MFKKILFFIFYYGEMSITFFIVIITTLVSVLAFKDRSLFSKLLFLPYDVKRFNQYYRFLTSGFIHANWMHLIFNMYVLFMFGEFVEVRFKLYFGASATIFFILMYLLAIIVSEIPSFFKHKDNSAYASLGASGAVSAIVFSSILFSPAGSIGIIFIPVQIPTIVFGLLYLAYSAYMSKYGSDNIAHSAHLFGALFGLIFPGLLDFELFMSFYLQLKSLF